MVAATTAEGSATTSAASATAPLPEGVKAVDDFELKGGGDDDSRRACNEVGRQRLGASPGGVRAVNNVGLRGGGDDTRRARDDVGG